MNESVPRSLPGRVREPRLGLLLKGILLLVVCAALMGGCDMGRAGGAPSVEFDSVVFWREGWFGALAGLVSALALLALYRHRVRRLTKQLNLRFEERLAERTRVAQEIHDTFLQDVLSVSMQLHMVVNSLPEDSPARAQLDHIQRLMGRVIEEGRNTLKGLRSE